MSLFFRKELERTRMIAVDRCVAPLLKIQEELDSMKSKYHIEKDPEKKKEIALEIDKRSEIIRNWLPSLRKTFKIKSSITPDEKS